MINTRNKVFLTAVSALILLGHSALGQDPYFTQFHEAPMSVSPAYIGNYFGPKARIVTNSRTQWLSTSNPFFTNSLTVDGKIKSFSDGELHNLSAGVMLLNDRSLGGALSRNSVSVGTSYYQVLGADGNQYLGLGISGTYRNDRADFSSLTWGNQYSNGAFNLAAPSGEPLVVKNPSMLMLAAGLNFITTNDERTSVLELGGSLYNINKPEFGMYSEDAMRYPQRLSLHAAYSTYLDQNAVDGPNNQVHLYGIYQRQGNVTYMQVGGRLDRYVNEKLSVGAGIWYRTPNAIIPYLAFAVGDLSFDMTYDMSKTGYLRYNSIEFAINYRIR
jgi:type IX secretion system PorP/SprF family membrane protein